MSDKERLEEIKNSYLEGLHELFGASWVSMPKEIFDWLIQQPKRVQELEQVIGDLDENVAAFETLWLEEKRKNKRYKQALEEIRSLYPLRNIRYQVSEIRKIVIKALEGDDD
jgi:hypothetical protein